MYRSFGNLLDLNPSKKTELVTTHPVNSHSQKLKNYRCYILLAIDAKRSKHENEILGISHNTYISDDYPMNSFSLSIKNGERGKKYFSFLKSNSETIRGIFEERFFLVPSGNLHLLASKYYCHHKINFCLLSLSTKVYCSAIISRDGKIENFLLNNSDLTDQFSKTIQSIDSNHSLIKNELNKFFGRIFGEINTAIFKEHFYNVFDLFLKGSFGFIDADFIKFKNQIMYKISFCAKVQFFVMLDNDENFLGIFSARNKESLTTGIVRVLKFYDDKLKIRLK